MDARVKPAHDKYFLSLQMFGEEIETARPGDIRARSVVTCPFVAVKAVLRAGINVDFYFRPLGADGLHIAKRNAGILAAEMQLGRHFRLVVGKANDRAAVITDRRRQARQFCRGGIGDAATETEPDDPNS